MLHGVKYKDFHEQDPARASDINIYKNPKKVKDFFWISVQHWYYGSRHVTDLDFSGLFPGICTWCWIDTQKNRFIYR